MSNVAVISRFRFGAILLGVALTLSVATVAHAHGGGGGGHGGGGFGGGHGGGFGGGHGGGRGGRGGFGHRGFGGRGFGFGFGGFGFYDGFGFLGYGLFYDSLPLYYSTYWGGGVPYYYANDNFYQWNGAVGQYQTVAPPESVANQAAQARENFNLFAYPKNGQTPEQQGTDRNECQQWAAGQTGVGAAGKRQDYLRAEAACLQGRGYSVQ
jgi:hypothetical protein